MSALSEALKQLRNGGMIILTDDESRENEGDLVMAAEFATPEAIAFMAQKACGLICLPMAAEQIDRLGLGPMVAANKARRSTAFTASIEAREGITTGISAFDRAHTIKVAADPNVKAGDIVSPGHIFPLRATEGGVLKRDGHTEGSVDLMILAGLNRAAVIVEIMGADGHMAKGEELAAFARTHNLPMLAISEIVQHRLATENWLPQVSAAALPTSYAETPLRIHAFRSEIDGVEHLALVKHPLPAVPLVRVHSECLTGEAFGSLRCDCGPQLQDSIRQVAESDGGMVIYLRGHEGRGIGLANKIAAYALQDKGYDTLDANTALGFAADGRDYAAATKILHHFGVKQVQLLTNNPAKEAALKDGGVAVVGVTLGVEPNPFNALYLETKRARFGHTLPPAAKPKLELTKWN
ncbi:3,4-dihydroxy-2-butanone-4-phosphate synthase [Aestuariivirga litoralis]|uniref:3,4-dihydroxy-2-butanone-4-phosphate synthase n=1 Tax=Aestuariivirga litoralis TaxID=2650924 RepID=UPI0018C7A0D4|nr:3,4-dihydroxy-2-butanone-4-phosphate synthase [Aestuariivirga litoralis]MBG1232085.1 3,4-dihydroxy-2-butanone-4-phosphate synthase [Aestuariivirga litoralis]